MDREVFAAAVLQLIEGLMPASIGALYQHFDSFTDPVLAPSQQLATIIPPPAVAALARYQQHPEAVNRQVEQLLAWCQDEGVQPLCLCNEEYPPLLKEISRPPPLLFIKGNSNLLAMPQLAIVGSRNPTTGGIDNATEFARLLSASGFVVTSGLALGTDAAAHRGALASGNTIAVIGSGIDVLYPRQHRQLYQQILESGGAIVSEFMPGMPPLAGNFPRRNRIISGLSLGVLVTEAAIKSGSLITARLAMEQNREVFAIPGSIHNPVSKGCHQLIRQGATLVETAEDIVEQLGGVLSFFSGGVGDELSDEVASGPELTASAQALLENMGFDPVDMDTLVARTGQGVAALSPLLMDLELKGLVENRGGNFCRIGY